MTYSHFRGELVTNKELKGVFSEAKDSIEEVFPLLRKAAANNPEVSIFHKPFGREPVIITVSGLHIEITKEGRFEIWEGAA